MASVSAPSFLKAVKSEIVYADSYIPTVSNADNADLFLLADKLVISFSNSDEGFIDVIKSLEQARMDMFRESKLDKTMSEPKCDNQFQLISEEIEELLSDSDTEDLSKDHVDVRRSKRLGAGKKIVKLCSPVFRVEPTRRRGRFPNLKPSYVWYLLELQGLGRPDKQRFLREMIMEAGCQFIGLIETMTQDIQPNWFRSVSGSRDFVWKQLPPTGRSGGLLLGVNSDVFEILNSELGRHYIDVLLKEKRFGATWHLVLVYGPAQVEDKENFLTEFARLCNGCQGPVVIGGDFNIIRKITEKNKPCSLPRWSHIFNSIIETAGLKELPLHGRLYTWANNHEDPTFEKLDRFFVSTKWELQFPLATVTALNRDMSDHVPLQLSTGVEPPFCNTFRFENCWLERDGFKEIVIQSWQAATYCLHDVDKWQEKARRLRRHLKGWHLNVEGTYKRRKKEVLVHLDNLDKKEETTILSLVERQTRSVLDADLKKLLRDEELKWRQRAKEKDLKEGDANTKYYHIKASGRKKKNHLSFIQNNGEEIVGDKNLIEHVTCFYKNLFGPPEVTSLKIDRIECDQISSHDRDFLTAEFTLEEIHAAVFGMKHNKAAGPDGFPAEFYQVF